MSYDSNIQIGNSVLEINPEQYVQQMTKLGQFIRTVGGGIIDMDMNGYRLDTEIRSITVTQAEVLKRLAALKKPVDFIDFVPIAEKSTRSREVYEDLGSEIVDGETVYLYVPKYKVWLVDFVPTYQGGVINYNLKIQEI